MSDCAACVPAPLPHAPNRRLRSPLIAVLVALVMITGGYGALALIGPSHPGTPAASMIKAASPPAGILSGAALAKAPAVQNPGTPYSSLTNVTGTTLVSPSLPLHFTVGFQMRNQAQLEQILTAQATPGSPMFHQWLTNDQEMAMFGPDPVVVQNTINYFTAQGFQVATRGILSISFSGTAAQVDQAFHTQIEAVALQGGGTRVLNTLPLSLPAPIYNGVVTVNGLDSKAMFHPTSFVNPALATELGLASSGGSGGAGALASVGPSSQLWSNISVAYNNSNHAFIWEHFLTPRKHLVTWQTLTPGSLTWLYNGTQLINAGINGNSSGTPITIAIVMGGGINPSDMRAFGQLVWNNPNNIMNRLTAVPVDGSFTTNGTLTYTDGVSGEMALDIEYSSTMAPGAHILAVYGPGLFTNVLDDDYATIWQMAKTPNIVSNSWGGDEDTSGNIYGPNFQNDVTMHNYFMLIDAKGSTIIASSGDGGGFDKGTGILAGSFPATDPYVLSIDGLRTVATDHTGVPFPTEPAFGLANISFWYPTNPPRYYPNYPLWVPQATNMLSQSYWYEPQSNTTVQTLPPSGSGGFGTSYWFNQTWFEHGYGVPDLGRSLGSGVAAEADFNMTIFFDGDFQFFYGGTSFACPTVAGELALIEDYLAAHGHNPYLGNGNPIVFDVANAFLNGNLTLKPFYDIVNNGTSFWGNRGVNHGYSWPPGQKFPTNAQGAVIYGNTTKGYDFPTGWGSIIVNNFAIDLNQLESMPGTFMTLNAAGTAYNPGAWANLATNQTYQVEVNASSAIAATNPHVTLKFIPENGANGSVQPALVPTLIPSAGFKFTLDTSVGPILGPGLLIFEFGNSVNPSLGFAYSWVSWALPTGGQLNVTVVQPSGSSIVGGYPSYTTVPGIGFFFPPITVFPSCCTQYPNTFTVHVTYNGKPVYNALVTATIASTSSLPWVGSRGQLYSESLSKGAEQSLTTLSQTYTNLTGFALVYTWNVVRPTTFFVNATYASAKAGTTYQVIPGPNIKASDNYGGKYSSFNTVDYLLLNQRLRPTPAAENAMVPNSVNQTALYSLIYGWQGQVLNLSTNDYSGAPMTGIHVWLANLDSGGENKFFRYQGNGGLDGVTNTSGTSTVTDFTGNGSLTIPDNQSDNNWFSLGNGVTYGFAFLAASVPGQQNRTFSYTEPCAPNNRNPNVKGIIAITCQFNNTYQRNYTSIPITVLANPVGAWTETNARLHQDFFGTGSNISWGVNVTLPNNDPFLNCFGCAWGYGLEHVVTANAYVDGRYAATLTPHVPPTVQFMADTHGNLSGTYAPGIHTLKVVVVDSMGHVFTKSHTFVVGSVTLQNLGIKDTYTVIPFVLNYSFNIPAAEVTNHSFSQSLEIRYLSGACTSTPDHPCPPVVVNYSKKIQWGVTQYNQSINITLLNLEHFYSGSGELPPGQYQVIVWLNANHSGSITASATTYFVFTAVSGHVNGPTANEVVPIGNVTISYSYVGGYVSNASLSVYQATQPGAPVFTVGAFVPGIGDQPRGGATVWPAVQGGAYQIILALGTPYGWANATPVWINVTATTGETYLNQTHANGPLGNMNPSLIATILALVAGVIGVLLGLYLAPSIRNGVAINGAGTIKPARKPWEEGDAPGSGSLRCPVCHDEFESAFALHQHQKISHGIEE